MERMSMVQVKNYFKIVMGTIINISMKPRSFVEAVDIRIMEQTKKVCLIPALLHTTRLT